MSRYNKIYNIEHIKPLAIVPDDKFENIWSMANENKEKQFQKEEEYRQFLINEIFNSGCTYNTKRLNKHTIKGLEFILARTKRK